MRSHRLTIASLFTNYANLRPTCINNSVVMSRQFGDNLRVKNPIVSAEIPVIAQLIRPGTIKSLVCCSLHCLLWLPRQRKTIIFWNKWETAMLVQETNLEPEMIPGGRRRRSYSHFLPLAERCDRLERFIVSPIWIIPRINKRQSNYEGFDHEGRNETCLQKQIKKIYCTSFATKKKKNTSPTFLKH